jgi:hydroxymethylpyrimidine/phosphomethylpyrimidine kinase
MSSEPYHPPVALTIAGSDSCGGAGIQADLKTFSVMGVYGATVLTAITAQNTRGVQAAQLLDVDLISAQLASVAEDLPIAASKTGMLGRISIIDTVADEIQRHRLQPLVVDPVMVAKSGDLLIDDNAIARMAERILPLATLLTPNRHEAARLLGISTVQTVTEAGDAAQEICERFGPSACIVKAAQDPDNKGKVVDVLFTAGEIHCYSADWLDTHRTHGSGCTFSAAITAALALGQPLDEAIRKGRQFISRAIAEAPLMGQGNPPVSPLAHLH